MQVEPDWSMFATPSELEVRIGNGFEFKGPGLYLSDSDTVLVVNSENFDAPFADDCPYWELYCWNEPLQRTLLRFSQGMPVREDLRNSAS